MGFSFAKPTAPNPASRHARFRFGLLRAFVLAALFGLAAGAHAGRLELSWQDNSENELGFEIERSRDGQSFGVLAAVEADMTGYTDASVLPGVAYQYRVRAFNDFGYSGYTNVSVGQLPNSAPIVDPLPSLSVLRGEPLDPILFSVYDAESPLDSLAFETISSNPTVLPLENISLELAEPYATLALAPVTSKTGVSTVTVLVSDGVETAERQFDLEVLPNIAPSISSMVARNTFDGMALGPIGFSVADAETPASELQVTAVSQDESLIATESIQVGGSGSARSLSFATRDGVEGSGSIRVTVSDGVNQSYAALVVNVERNLPPTLEGLEDSYTIPSGGALTGLPFSVGDAESGAAGLSVTAASTNALILPRSGIKVKGSGANRALDVAASEIYSGSVELVVSVSDGARVTSKSVQVRVLPPERVVTILDFTVEQGLAVVEVENLPESTFSLWKIHSRDGAWEELTDAEIFVEGGSVFLIDPTRVAGAVCYRVVASE